MGLNQGLTKYVAAFKWNSLYSRDWRV